MRSVNKKTDQAAVDFQTTSIKREKSIMPVALVTLDNIVELRNYKLPTVQGPCVVEFIGFEFTTPEDVVTRLNFQVNVEDGDFEAAINEVKRNGGIYLPTEDSSRTHWFLPWPCAAVRIRPKYALSS